MSWLLMVCCLSSWVGCGAETELGFAASNDSIESSLSSPKVGNSPVNDTVADDIPISIDGTRPADFKPVHPVAAESKQGVSEQDKKDEEIEAMRERDYFLNSIKTPIRSADDRLEKMKKEFAKINRSIKFNSANEEEPETEEDRKKKADSLEADISDLQRDRDDLDDAIEQINNADVIEWERHRDVVDRLLIKIR